MNQKPPKPRDEMAEPSFNRLKFKGKSVGADMVVVDRDYQDCCSINIYVNNNITGANNSLLVGSTVKMGDPGPRLTFKGLKFNHGSNARERQRVEAPSWLRFFEIFLVVVMVVLLLYQAVLL